MSQNRKKAVVGCDPGDKGSIALICLETKSTSFIPTTLPPIQLAQLYKNWMELYDIQLVVVEDVHAIRGAAAKSTFNFGANVQKMLDIPLVLGLSVERLTPRVWQKEMQISVPKALKGNERKKAIKKAVQEKVSNLFPAASIYGPMGGLLDGRTDAMAIAEAGRRIFKV